MIKTGSSTITLYFEDGQEVFPCRCGETHQPGYDFGHHNCFHETDLLLENNRDGSFQVICPDCGMAWSASLLSGAPPIKPDPNLVWDITGRPKEKKNEIP